MSATTELEKRTPGLTAAPHVYIDDKTPDGCVTVALAYDAVDVPLEQAVRLASDLLALVGAIARTPHEELLRPQMSDRDVEVSPGLWWATSVHEYRDGDGSLSRLHIRDEDGWSLALVETNVVDGTGTLAPSIDIELLDCSFEHASAKDFADMWRSLSALVGLLGQIHERGAK